jgi:hypothetical protein
LFEQDVLPLQIQKHNRELEILIQEGILNTIRDSIPVEAILKQYMEQTIEEDVVEEIKEQIIEDTSVKVNTVANANANSIVSPIASVIPIAPASANAVANTNSQISFDDMDYIKDHDNQVMSVDAPKTIERLEEISELRAKQRKLDEAEESDGDKIKIYDDFVNLDAMDIHVIDEPKLQLLPDLLLDDIEVLD